MKHFPARQGDVYLELVSEIPTGLATVPREHGRVVLAHGEVTGHAHAIAEQSVDLLARPGDTVGEAAERWLRVQNPGGAVLAHEEHASVALAPGLYRVIRQREWSDADEPILVAD